MNRLMFSKKESAKLIHKAIDMATMGIEKPFILCKIMKNVNLLELAKSLSDQEIEIIGKRPGEKLNETLISKKELPNTKVLKDYVFIFNSSADHTLQEEHSSLTAEIMSKEEMRDLVWN